MKKIICLALCLVFILMLISCKSNPKTSEDLVWFLPVTTKATTISEFTRKMSINTVHLTKHIPTVIQAVNNHYLDLDMFGYKIVDIGFSEDRNNKYEPEEDSFLYLYWHNCVEDDPICALKSNKQCYDIVMYLSFHESGEHCYLTKERLIDEKYNQLYESFEFFTKENKKSDSEYIYHNMPEGYCCHYIINNDVPSPQKELISEQLFKFCEDFNAWLNIEVDG